VNGACERERVLTCTLHSTREARVSGTAAAPENECAGPTAQVSERRVRETKQSTRVGKRIDNDADECRALLKEQHESIVYYY
jgi:hypothetical protein